MLSKSRIIKNEKKIDELLLEYTCALKIRVNNSRSCKIYFESSGPVFCLILQPFPCLATFECNTTSDWLNNTV